MRGSFGGGSGSGSGSGGSNTNKKDDNDRASFKSRAQRAKNRFMRSGSNRNFGSSSFRNSSTGSGDNNSGTFSVGSLGSGSREFGLAAATNSSEFTATPADVDNHLKRENNVLRTSKHQQEAEKIGALTSNKIRFSSLGTGENGSSGTLYGREEETAVLKCCLGAILPWSASSSPAERSRPANHTRSLVLLKGYSGIGKTALARTLERPVQKELNGLFVQGKFDLYLRDAQPYFGIATACREICKQISTLQGRAFGEIQAQLQQKLEKDLHLLTKVIPELESIVHLNQQQQQRGRSSNASRSASDTSKARGGGGRIQFSDRNSERSLSGSSVSSYRNAASSSSGGQAQRSRDRFHYVFRQFFRIITTFYSPLVVVLDDLQWADVQSLELIQSLLTDWDNRSFMILGLYRSNEVEMDTGYGRHILTTMINNLRETAKEEPKLVMLEVGNLGLEAVKSVTMDLLSLDDIPDTLELAQLCHKRTQGNVFFLISFIAMLEEEGHLKYDYNVGAYKWDIETVKTETGAASNLVDLMNTKMSKLPEDYGLLLSLAACLGSRFDTNNLGMIWKGYTSQFTSMPVDHSVSVEERLAQAMQDGYVETFDNVTYRWIHDRVQEAALTLIPDEDAPAFKYRVGQILCGEMTELDIDDSIFLIANLLNEKPMEDMDETERIQVAEINLGATQKAVSFSAFSSAVRYSGIGIDLLPPQSWERHYELTLDLYSYAVEATDFIGEHDKMKVYSDTVLDADPAICPIQDKLRVYYVLAYNIANAGKSQEAVDLIQGVLAELGCKFPKTGPGRFVSTLAGILKMQSTMKAKTREDINNLPEMTDSKQIEIMKFLDKLNVYTYLSGSDLCALSILRGAELTWKHGLSEYSPSAIAVFCTICSGSLNDPQSATKIGEDALLLLDRLDTLSPSSQTKMVIGAFAFSWTKPFSNVMPLMLESYQDGMANGDNESAGFAIVNYLMLCFMSGRPLNLVQADCANYSKQLKEMKRQQGLDYISAYHQPTQNLLGLSPDPTLIQGDVIPDAKQFCEQYESNLPMVAIWRGQQLRLYATFGEHEKGAALFLAHGFEFPKLSPGHPIYMHAVFCGGLCCFDMAQKGKRKYRAQAMKARKTIKSWLKMNNPNVKHCEALLDAEKAVLGGKKKVAEQFYQSAIAMAARGGFTQDAALASERYGEFALLVLKDRDGAKYHLDRALQFYGSWGASKKVELLKVQYADMLEK